MNALRVAANCLSHPSLIVGNLLGVPTHDTGGMSDGGREASAWEEARNDLARAVGAADSLLAAWGVVPPGGPARRHHHEQLTWLIQAARDAGHDYAWTIGGEPRHPSRWHVYASDRHGRTEAGLTRTERVRQLLVPVPLDALLRTPPRLATAGLA